MPDERPNIVLVMTDQQRADFTAAEDFALDTTPFLDSLAASGTRFRRAYTPLPACVPARCSLLTGRFPKATGVRENGAARLVHRTDDLLDVLRAAGYSLHLAGKTHMYRGEDDFDTYAAPYWHERGPQGRASPQQAEFEDWLRALDHAPSHEPTPYPLECQFPHRIVSDAIEAVDDRAQDRPNFFWLSFPEPHNPYQVPEPYFSLFDPDQVPERACGPEAAQAKGGPWRWLREVTEEKRPGYDAEWRRYRANYCGMLRLIDDQVRRFVDHLRARGLAQDTLFVFLSDHGDYAGDFGLQRKGAGLPECLMRVPLIVAGPGVREGDNGEDFVSLVDLLPTVCEMLGRDIPFGVQGRSLWPLLAGETYPRAEFSSIYAECGIGGLPYGADERPALDPKRDFDYAGRSFLELNSVTQSGNTKMLRRGNWKLLYDSTGNGELYDLAADPAELNNRFDEPDLQETVRVLLAELLEWTVRTEDELPTAVYAHKRAERNWYRVDTQGPSPESPASP